MIENRTKRTLADGAPVMAMTLNFPHAGLAEYVGALGFDCIAVDGEHGAVSESELENITRACECSGATLLVRLPVNDALMQRYLGMGVAAFHVPQIRSAAQAQAAIDAIKFPPLGRRGLGTFRANHYGLSLGSWPAFMQRANDETLIVIAIEDREGLAALPQLVALPAIDVILIGTSDLSADLGVPGQTKHPEVQAAVTRAIATIREGGKVAGLPAGTTAEVDAVYAQGARFILTSVARTLASSARELLGAVRAL